MNGYTYGSNVSYASPGDTYAGTGQLQNRRMIPQAFLDRLGRTSVSSIILITVRAGMWLKGAVVHSGRTMKFDAPTAVDSVVMNNGQVGLDEETSSANVVANPGTWFYDSATGILYVNPPDPTARSFFDDTYQAKLVFYFSNVAKTFRSAYWRPLLTSAPDLRMSIDPRFTGVGQIGSGNVTLENADGFFDLLDDNIQWDSGEVTMELGLDLPGGAMDEADYQTFGTWRIERTERDASRFTLVVREPKTNLENLIPRREFTRAEFPQIAEDLVGKPIPWGWGRLFGVKPTLINRNTKKFKLADHPIRSLEAVRIKRDGEGWKQINYETVDLRKAEFTLGDAWEDQEVSVDFFGRTNADGSLMENPSDVMADLLDYVGEVNLDGQSFAASRSYYRIGTDKFGEVTKLAPCIYLTDRRPALEVASQINSIAGSFLFVGFDGLWRYGAFIPCRASSLDPMAGTVIQSFSELDIIDGSMRKQVDNKDLVSKIIARYAERTQEEWAQSATAERKSHGYLHNLSPLFTKTVNVGLGKTTDALYWAQRYLTTEAEPLTRYYFDVPWKGFLLLPGDKIKAVYSRFSLNSVLELLEVRYDLNSLTAKFVTGNLRGWNDTHGFWVEDGADPIPTVPMTGLRLWLSASDLPNTTSLVQSWQDKSGQGNHATQETAANRPVYSMFAGPNEGPGVVFDQGQYLNLPNFASAFTQGEIFAVIRAPLDPATDAFGNVPWDFGAAAGGEFTQYPRTDGVIVEGFGKDNAAETFVDPAADLTLWRIYNVSIDSASAIARIDNSVIATNLTPTVGFPSSLRLGGTAFDPAYYFGGAIAEIVVYDRVLSASERSAVVQRLSDAYTLGLVAAGTSPVWNPAWTDEQVAEARQNRGYHHGQSGGKETHMADPTDSRSFEASRWN